MRIPPIVTMLLWIAPLMIQALIVLAIILRHQISDFAWFFIYLVCVSLRDVILLFTRADSDLYSLVYWIGDAVLILMGTAAIYEVFWKLVKPYGALRLLGKQILWITIAVLLAAGIALFTSSSGIEASRSIQIVLLAERSARFVQVGALILVIGLVSHFGLGWRHNAAGIIIGFGVAAGLQLGVYELKANLQGITDDVFKLLTPAAYDFGVMIWALYFLSRYRGDKLERLSAADLSKLDRVLAEFIKR